MILLKPPTGAVSLLPVRQRVAPPLTCESHLCLLSRSGLLELNVSGCPWAAVSALCQAVCPCLKLLDLSRVEDLKDSHLRELLAPPPDTRTGETPTSEHLRLHKGSEVITCLILCSDWACSPRGNQSGAFPECDRAAFGGFGPDGRVVPPTDALRSSPGQVGPEPLREHHRPDGAHAHLPHLPPEREPHPHQPGR